MLAKEPAGQVQLAGRLAEKAAGASSRVKGLQGLSL